MTNVKKNADGEELQLSGKPNGGAAVSPNRCLFGRKEIFTSEREINASNVIKVLNKALVTHQQNRADIDYLHRYLRGEQPIINRVKKYNKEICNRIVVNRASEIVTFKTANFIGEPLQYVSRGAYSGVPEQIEKLNSFMFSERKQEKDMTLAYWMFTGGIGYRLTLNDKSDQYKELFDEAPFEIYTLDPRNTFVVKANDVTRRVMMGVNYVYRNSEKKFIYTVYTANQTFTIEGSLLSANKITNIETHNIGMVSIVEYPCNALRMGAFEPVIDLLDAINLIASDRLDGIEQFIQAYWKFIGCDLDKEKYHSFLEEGAILVPPNANGGKIDVDLVTNELNQVQTQTLVDDMYQTVLSIVGMPSQGNANTSDSSNNGAVIMKNGWWNAESRAKETEGMWKGAETDFLKIVLKICHDSDALDLKISQIEQKFFRRSYEDLLVKTQSFTSLIGAGCPPTQAYQISGIVLDPESAGIAYERYQQEKEEELEKQLEREKPTETIVTDNVGGEEVTEKG